MLRVCSAMGELALQALDFGLGGQAGLAFLQAASAFLQAVSQIKNYELAVTTVGGGTSTEFDLVDRFYRSPSLRAVAEGYRW